jgi:hypothetical protein
MWVLLFVFEDLSLSVNLYGSVTSHGPNVRESNMADA